MTRQQEHIESRLKNLEAIKAFESSEAFTLLILPLQERIESMKHAYKMKVETAKRYDGLWEGLNFVLDLLEQYKQDGQLAQETEAKIARKKFLEEQEIDSRDL